MKVTDRNRDELYDRKNLCECMHWKHEHRSKKSWIMRVLFGGEYGKCRAKGWREEKIDCQCEGFELHTPLCCKK